MGDTGQEDRAEDWRTGRQDRGRMDRGGDRRTGQYIEQGTGQGHEDGGQHRGQVPA